MENLNRIVEKLLAESQQRAAKILAEARGTAAQIIAEAEEKARKECPGILERYKKQAQDYVVREKLHGKMEAQRALLAVKQELVDQVLNKIYERFIHLKEQEWIDVLKLLLEHWVDQPEGIKPTIIAPASLEARVRAFVGTNYPVVAGEQEHGFIFSFPNYDQNYELERLFTYQREHLEELAAKYLFSGDDNG